MFRNLSLSALVAIGLSTGSAFAAGSKTHIEDFDFSFEGPFGAYDQMQLQRGLKVYTEVCAVCHGLKYVPIRDLHSEAGPGFSEDEVRAYAAQNFEVWDPELADGEGDFRAAIPTDHFPTVTSAGAPDLSLMAKSRAGFHGPYGLGINQFFKGIGGPEYIASLMTGYADAPECTPEDFDGHYNTAFASGGYPDECKYEDGSHKYPGSWISMGPPLEDGLIDFDDGHSNDLHHMSEDVAAFLMWTAEPKMMARKQAGFAGVFFLAVLSVLLYLVNKRLWAPIKRKDEA